MTRTCSGCWRSPLSCVDGFVAGAYVADEPGAPFDLDGYLHAAADISSHGGTPVVFPSYGLNAPR